MTPRAGHYDEILIRDRDQFVNAALETFKFQARFNPVYKAYMEALQISPATVSRLEEIPFLPILFFKSHEVMTGGFEPAGVFESSGTTGSTPSRHFVRDLGLYEASFGKAFELFYGNPSKYCVIGLLPSYLERGHSSLVYMVNRLIQLSPHPRSGFYLDDAKGLALLLEELESEGQATLLIGVTFALLDFAAEYPLPLRHTILMETGGMKGRRKEMIREEVHRCLMDAFGLPAIHSEYGMTELLSQAYSKSGGLFQCPPWMKIMARDEEDPFQVTASGAGALNIIDLANIHSCSFIATDDAGKVNPDGTFSVLGRMDGSDLRGCSLLTM